MYVCLCVCESVRVGGVTEMYTLLSILSLLHPLTLSPRSPVACEVVGVGIPQVALLRGSVTVGKGMRVPQMPPLPLHN